MSQQSKLKQSRQQRKQKAKERAEQNATCEKNSGAFAKSATLPNRPSKRPKSTCAKKRPRPTYLKAQRVWLTLSLFAGARISFRAVSRVLHVLAPGLGIGKAPCPNPLQPWPAVVIVKRMAIMHLRDFGFRMEIVTLLERPAELLRNRLCDRSFTTLETPITTRITSPHALFLM
jgi:hypothetical protein